MRLYGAYRREDCQDAVHKRVGAKENPYDNECVAGPAKCEHPEENRNDSPDQPQPPVSRDAVDQLDRVHELLQHSDGSSDKANQKNSCHIDILVSWCVTFQCKNGRRCR